MIIFFEGPDGCGKTNISKAVAKHYDIPYFKCSTEHSNWKNGAFKSSIPFDILLPEFVRQTKMSLVSDRGYLSEIVYAEAYERDTDCDSLWTIDAEWSKMNAIVVYCMRRDYSNVEDEVVAKSALPMIHDIYKKMARLSECHSIKIYVDDYDDEIEFQLDDLIKKINLLKDLNSDPSVKVELECLPEDIYY